MPVLRSTTVIDAVPRTVAGLLRDTHVVAESGARAGHGLRCDVRLLSAGDEMRVMAAVSPWTQVSLTLAVRSISISGMTSVLVAGPLPGLRHTVTLTEAGGGTLVVDELSWTTPPGLRDRVADAVRSRASGLLAARADVLIEQAAALVAGPVVVASAVVRDGYLLVAQRTRPPALAGRWELPGGRVEPGESEVDAVVRECREELAVEVRATGRIGTDLPIDAGVLRVHGAELAAAGEPRAVEHAALRWVGPDELDAVDWVDADRAVVADLRALLRANP